MKFIRFRKIGSHFFIYVGESGVMIQADSSRCNGTWMKLSVSLFIRPNYDDLGIRRKEESIGEGAYILRRRQQ